MNVLSAALNKCLRYRSFRIFLAYIFPIVKKMNVIGILHKFNKGSFSDAWTHFKDYDSLDKRYVVDFKKFVHIRKSYLFAFITDSEGIDIEEITKAAELLDVRCIFFEISDPDLYVKLSKCNCDGVLICPSYNNNLKRTMFHEAAQIISTETSIELYPTIRELNFYESKRSLANFLAINDIPHPRTKVFYDFERAEAYLNSCSYPIVAKTHCGASASGVEILTSKRQAVRLGRQMFRKYYLKKLESDKRNTEWGYLLLQEYIDEVKEFRIIKAGESWFGYQKWKDEDQTFLSGSGKFKIVEIASGLLDFCNDIAARFHFTTMCFDIFETREGKYLVNELQTWFGSYDPTEMFVNDIPGRYRLADGTWTFEPGYYNVYGSNLLRLTHFISILQAKQPVQILN
jgi:hypothetical protein